MFLISQAYAQSAPAQVNASGSGVQFIFIAIMFAVIWYLILRPQQKRAKEHRNMLEALKKGDEVMTNGGLMGRVIAFNDQAIDIEIAKGIIVRLQKGFIVQTLPKGSLKADLTSPAVEEKEVKETKDSKEEKIIS